MLILGKKNIGKRCTLSLNIYRITGVQSRPMCCSNRNFTYPCFVLIALCVLWLIVYHYDLWFCLIYDCVWYMIVYDLWLRIMSDCIWFMFVWFPFTLLFVYALCGFIYWFRVRFLICRTDEAALMTWLDTLSSTEVLNHHDIQPSLGRRRRQRFPPSPYLQLLMLRAADGGCRLFFIFKIKTYISKKNPNCVCSACLRMWMSLCVLSCLCLCVSVLSVYRRLIKILKTTQNNILQMEIF